MGGRTLVIGNWEEEMLGMESRKEGKEMEKRKGEGRPT